MRRRSRFRQKPTAVEKYEDRLKYRYIEALKRTRKKFTYAEVNEERWQWYENGCEKGREEVMTIFERDGYRICKECGRVMEKDALRCYRCEPLGEIRGSGGRSQAR